MRTDLYHEHRSGRTRPLDSDERAVPMPELVRVPVDAEGREILAG
jgi:hypothetical protein